MLSQCAVATDISWTTLQECLSSGQADELLAANGRRTDKLIPDLINFVPTIVFNDVFSTQLQSLSYTNFENTFVFLLEQVQCGFCQFSGTNAVVSCGKIVFGFLLLLFVFQKLPFWYQLLDKYYSDHLKNILVCWFCSDLNKILHSKHFDFPVYLLIIDNTIIYYYYK